MKRLHIPFLLMFMSLVTVQAQTFTFNMQGLDNKDVNYEINVNVSSRLLSAYCNGSKLFALPYYKHEIFKEKNRIAFALKEGYNPDASNLSNDYFIIIRDNGYIITKLPDGKEYKTETTNWLTHVQEYDKLEKALENSSSAVLNPPSEFVNTFSEDNDSNIIFTVNGVSFTMVYVEGGSFMMGVKSAWDEDASESESPAHKVTLHSYLIGQTEVTQELWETVMGYNPSMFQDKNCPVEQISWNDCLTFIAELNSLTGRTFRLPTEAEWEFAARGGNKGRGYKYSGSKKINDVAWYWQNSGDRFIRGDDSSWEPEKIQKNHCRVHPVGTKSPNELGIYDMSGNVWEWCQDWFGKYTNSPQTNPTGPSIGSSRIFRGGCWEINAKYCRVTTRFRTDPRIKNYNLGLRLAL